MESSKKKPTPKLNVGVRPSWQIDLTTGKVRLRGIGANIFLGRGTIASGLESLKRLLIEKSDEE